MVKRVQIEIAEIKDDPTAIQFWSDPRRIWERQWAFKLKLRAEMLIVIMVFYVNLTIINWNHLMPIKLHFAVWNGKSCEWKRKHKEKKKSFWSSTGRDQTQFGAISRPILYKRQQIGIDSNEAKCEAREQATTFTSNETSNSKDRHSLFRASHHETCATHHLITFYRHCKFRR